MLDAVAWLSVGLLVILGTAFVWLLGSPLVRKRQAYEPSIQAWTATLRSLSMQGRHVGWVRTHWRHWEPIVWGDETTDVWEELRAYRSPDEDGERVVLPYGERPVNLYSSDPPLN